MCDSGSSDHMTGDATNVFNRKALSKDQEWVTKGDGTVKKVLLVGTLNLKLHYNTDVALQLSRVHVVDGFAINLFSLHAVQAKYAVTLDSTGVDLLGGKITLPCGTKGFSLSATRLPPSHSVKIAAITSVSRPASPSVPPPATVELVGARVQNFLPPPPTTVETSGVHGDDFLRTRLLLRRRVECMLMNFSRPRLQFE